MALRDAARFLGVSRTTIARKLAFLGEQAKRRNEMLLLDYQLQHGAIKRVQFDDLITAEHTKCKPITSMDVVEEKTGIIVEYSLAQIPAFGKTL